jgi:O-antigen/teichoic acid export membrane protein
MGLSQGFSLLLQFIASVVLARYLTVYEMGIYAIAAATVGLLSLIQAFGLQSLIVREEVLDQQTLRTAFTINLLIGIFLAVGVAGISIIGGRALGDEKVRQVMLALAINPLIGIFDFLPGAQLERAGRFKALALAASASGVSAAVVTIVASIAGAHYMTAAYAGWASAATYAAFVNVIGRQHIQFRLDLGR